MSSYLDVGALQALRSLRRMGAMSDEMSTAAVNSLRSVQERLADPRLWGDDKFGDTMRKFGFPDDDALQQIFRDGLVAHGESVRQIEESATYKIGRLTQTDFDNRQEVDRVDVDDYGVS